jgi:hypothetical protein
MIADYDRNARMVTFLPRLERMDFKELKAKYDLQRRTMASA